MRPTLIRYRDARAPICAYLADPRRAVNPLVQAEQMFRQRAQDPGLSALQHDDAEQSIEVLRAVQGMGNQLAGYSFHIAPRRQAKLILANVEVSVWADLLVHGQSRSQEQIGGAVLRMTQDDAATAEARDRRREMGLYVATLARLHLGQNIASDRQPANRLCMSIDVQHGEVFVASNSTTRRINHLTSACTMIAALWASV